MLRTLRSQAQAAPDGQGAAAGIKLKCLSCDSDLQPVYFATVAGPQHAADLRYSQLPAASPARPATQAWSPLGADQQPGSPGAGGGVLPPVPRSGQGSSPGSGGGGGGGGAVTHRAAVGAPVSWMHRMRREGQPEGSTSSGGGGVGASGGPARLLTSVHLEVGPGIEGLPPPSPASQQHEQPHPAWGEGVMGPSFDANASELLQQIREEPAPPPSSRPGADAQASAGAASLLDTAALAAAAEADEQALPARRAKTALPALSSSPTWQDGKIRAVRASVSGATPSLLPSAQPRLGSMHAQKAAARLPAAGGEGKEPKDPTAAAAGSGDGSSSVAQ